MKSPWGLKLTGARNRIQKAAGRVAAAAAIDYLDDALKPAIIEAATAVGDLAPRVDVLEAWQARLYRGLWWLGVSSAIGWAVLIVTAFVVFRR